MGVLIRPTHRLGIREGPVMFIDEGERFDPVLTLIRPLRLTTLGDITEIEAHLAGYATPFAALVAYCDTRPGSYCDSPVSVVTYEKLGYV